MWRETHYTNVQSSNNAHVQAKTQKKDKTVHLINMLQHNKPRQFFSYNISSFTVSKTHTHTITPTQPHTERTVANERHTLSNTSQDMLTLGNTPTQKCNKSADT